MIILLLGTHLFLTIRLKCPQRYIFKAIKLSFKKDDSGNGDVNHFASLATSLAATIGTGNIVSLGGPGAVLWCWFTGVFGIATKYAEGLLAVQYRQKTPEGKMLGGPMFALEKGLGAKWLAVLFCIFTVFASMGIGSTIQCNAISTMVHDTMGIETWITGAIIALFVALVVIRGINGISKVCSVLVPVMAVLYVLGCITILIMNWSFVGAAISLIVKSAFNFKSAAGGLAGFTVMTACRYGIARGLFSNESGLGSAPIVAAAAQTRNPVRQALVSSTGTFWDTVIICALTGIVVVSSILAYSDMDFTSGSALTQLAFSKIPYIGTPVIVLSIIAFAFSTILGWSYYSERAVEYLSGTKYIMAFRVFFVAMVFVGGVAELQTVWNFADIFNAMMAVPNLISLVLLSGVCYKLSQKYLWKGNRDADIEEE